MRRRPPGSTRTDPLFPHATLVRSGLPALRTPWPTDEPGLSRAQWLDLQKRLLDHGHDIGVADGKIGPATRSGIAAAERRFGMDPTGRAGERIYRALGGEL